MSFLFAACTWMFYYYRDGLVEPANLYLPYKMRLKVNDKNVIGLGLKFCIFVFISLPYNGNTYFGWFLSLIHDLVCGSTYACLNVSILSFFVSTGAYFYACRKHFCAILNDMSNENMKQQANVRHQLQLLFIDAIELHNQSKRCSTLKK